MLAQTQLPLRFSVVAGATHEDFEKYPKDTMKDHEIDTECRIAIYTCKNCDNYHINPQPLHEKMSITIGRPNTEDDECYACGGPGEEMELTSVYDASYVYPEGEYYAAAEVVTMDEAIKDYLWNEDIRESAEHKIDTANQDREMEHKDYLSDAEEKEIWDETEQWYRNNIDEVEGFYLRRDGTVELDRSS